MPYTATVKGTYKSKVRVDFLFFHWHQGWKTQDFSFTKLVDVPEIHYGWMPVKNVPLAIDLDINNDGATISLQALSENFPVYHQEVPSGGAKLHWEPLKGVIVEAMIELKPVPAAVPAGG